LAWYQANPACDIAGLFLAQGISHRTFSAEEVANPMMNVVVIAMIIMI
jgi:hypothetical protein